MEHPEELRPGKTRDELTAEAAQQFAALAERLRGRGHEPHAVAHFLNKLLFCMFAEDAGLLPADLLRRLAGAAPNDPAVFADGLGDLFAKMADKGGLFGAERIQWFNGGLFDGGEVLPLTRDEIAHGRARLAARLVAGRAGHLRHALRARPRPEQAHAARRPLHRPRLDHAPHRAGAA